MLSDIYWINAGLAGRLAIMARPRAGDWLEDEIDNWRKAGIDCVVSLLEPVEVRELGLTEEASLCRGRDMTFTTFPIPDRQVPSSTNETRILVEALHDLIASGKAVAVHCRAGIGRSGMIAACLLGRFGFDAVQALAMISAARGVQVPDTEEQRSWVGKFGETVA
ncbi:MAG TPA: dual specificity protein phosphatase family protein [Terriglobales bacterium]|nr:dual specificity protein phosphatase family protein [Terriglobales bacterium]